MGCTSSRPTHNSGYANRDGPRSSSRRNAEIEERLLQVQKEEKNTVKILLLGAGESGKSTVLKQMRLIHGIGFSEFERIQYTKVIWSDCIKSMKILITQARRLQIPLGSDDVLVQAQKLTITAKDGFDDDSKEYNEFLQDYEVQFESEIHQKAAEAARSAAQAKREVEMEDGNLFYDDTRYEEDNKEDEDLVSQRTGQAPSKEEIADAISKLWQHDTGIKQTLARANEFQLEVNAEYYFNNIYSYCQSGYMATDQDILVGRIKTTGITETVFDIGKSHCKMIDVGGQRSERKKWIHCFDNATAILFVAAVSEYDEVLFEDRSVNRMTEAKELFDQVINSRWFAHTPIILFLNKTDILQTKLKKRSFKKYFNDFNGDQSNVDDVCAYLKRTFLSINRVQSRPIYVHRTCATDTKSMKFVMSAVTDVVFQKNLLYSGVI